ncbi:MAG: DJ-1/PfpI family protein, partial [Ferrovibrionaceae bacterium]
PKTLKPSPALSLIAKAPETIAGRKIGVLMTDGTDAALLAAIAKAAKAEGAQVALVAPAIGGITAADGSAVLADQALSGAPSTLFDAVVVAPGQDGVAALLREAAAIDWLRDAFGHLKVIGHVPAAKPLFDKAGIDMNADAGTISVAGKGAAVKGFLTVARRQRIWDREPLLRTPG